MVERTGRRASGGADLSDGDLRRSERGARACHEGGDDCVWSGLRRRARVAAEERRAVAVDASDRGADVGAAEIEPQIEG